MTSKVSTYILYNGLLLVLLLLAGCFPSIKQKEAPGKPIKELEKRMDVTFTLKARSSLRVKYEKEANGSDFYWQELSKYVEGFKKLHPQKRKITFTDIEEFLSKEYGILILKSRPTGATVDFEDYTGEQGTTPCTTSLPVGQYTVTLKKEKCRSKTVEVPIQANDTTNITVKLECNAMSKMIEPDFKLEQKDKQKIVPRGE